MARLEDLTRGASVKGILPDSLVTIVDIKWLGSSVVELTYKDTLGRPHNQLLYRDQEPMLEIATVGRPWSFDSDGALFRLVSEAYRIRLAHLFDPMLAVHSSLVEPLPHQITAVYGEMLTRQPLKFLLADDPGAGKTIMTGLFLKELLMRGDLKRCLIVCPGSLTEQWQDELYRRFHLEFDILTRDLLNSARTGNIFTERNLIIARLDQLSRNVNIQDKLKITDWDVIVCDEAHKMSASYFGNEMKATQRYKLGQLLAKITRHFLLLTATPHNGKEEDFQLFLSLLDTDRFEGKPRNGAKTTDTSDLMRRMVKEQLVKFDGTPLFPERRAYTVNYKLSDGEAQLYAQVTEYVREEMNRADRLAREGEGKRGNMVGFALTVLQRRLASSPEAIYQSIKRRHERLEKRLRQEKIVKRGNDVAIDTTDGLDLPVDEDGIDDFYEEHPSEEVEQTEEAIVDRASAARTIKELEFEIATLYRLESLAYQVRHSGADRKWDELSKLLQRQSQLEAADELFDAQGHRRKLIIFSEHRDTLNYLNEKIRTLLGRPEAVVTIDGSVNRDERRRRQEAFTQDKDVLILIATDAAGEGINLQRAHLMVNYDLPWNPNRIEQRFGRIHRIGQTEVCHLWNLVAPETREGDVFQTLLQKLGRQREALGGSVFDVLGKCFTEQSLRDLLIEAVRYGDSPEVKARLNEVIDQALDVKRLKQLLEERALTHEALTPARVQQIREDMERAEARRLQPHFISSFFREALKLLGGSIHERESKRYEIKHVPADIRNRDRVIGTGAPVLKGYERVTFEKDLRNVVGKPLAEFVCPGHPLLDAIIDLVLEKNRDLLKRGAILVDPQNQITEMRALFYLEHSIQDARTDASGSRRIVSRRMQFAEVDQHGQVRDAGYAPYLDYRPLHADERAVVTGMLEADWLHVDLESQIIGYAAQQLVPSHLNEVKSQKEKLIHKTMAAVKERLTREIMFWDNRAIELEAQELAGKPAARLNSSLARQRADDLEARLKQRMEELEQERHLSPLAPIVIGGALVIPQALVEQLLGQTTPNIDVADRTRIDQLAIAAVLEAERKLGREPHEMLHNHPGYDVESRDAVHQKLLFIEVKGKVVGQPTVTISKTQVLTGLNKPDDFILAIAQIENDSVHSLRYIRQPFTREPDFGVVSINYDWDELWSKGNEPG